MGACLSKKGKKGKGGEDPDKQPYLPTKADDNNTEKAKEHGDAQTTVDVSKSKEPGASDKRQGDRSPSKTKATGGAVHDNEKAEDVADDQESRAVVRQDAFDDAGAPPKPPRANVESSPAAGLAGTETTTVRQSLEHSGDESQTVFVKETDVKVELSSPDQHSVQVSRERKVIERTQYNNVSPPTVAPTSSVYTETKAISGASPTPVVPTLAPIESGDRFGPGASDAPSTKENAAPSGGASNPSSEPMALFGALKYLKDQEDPGRPTGISGNETNADNSSSAVNDIFSNMYKPSDLSNLSYKENTSTRSEVKVVGDVETTRTQVVTSSETVIPLSGSVSQQRNVTPPKADDTVWNKSSVGVVTPPRTTPHKREIPPVVVQREYSPPKTAEKPVGKPSPEISLSIPAVRTPEATTEEITSEASPATSSPPPSPLTPLLITEQEDMRPPLMNGRHRHDETNMSGHVDAKVVISPGEPTSSPSTPEGVQLTESTDASPPIESPEIEAELCDVELPDEEDEEEEEEPETETEPVVRKNLRRMIKALLYDFSEANKTIMNRHELCPNTRQRIMNTVEKWLAGGEEATIPRVSLITGPTGIGKSCLVAELCKRHGDKVAGYHFFEYNNPNLHHNHLRSVVISLAHGFCDVFPNYINMLPKLDKLEQLVSHGDVSELYDALLYAPLTSPGLEHDPEKHMMIIIDAIDECNFLDRDLVLETIKNMNEHAPDWLHLLVTCRNDSRIFSAPDGLHTMELRYSSNDNIVDIKRYFKEPMGRFMDRISLDGGLTQLAKKTEGSFLCATLLKKKLDVMPAGKKIAMREIVPMFQSSLSGVCREMFTNLMDTLSTIVHDGVHKRAYASILSALVVAQEPLPTEFVCDVLHSNFQDVTSALSDIMDVLLVENNRISFCHKAIGEWLLDDHASGHCGVELVSGRDQIASLCLQWLGDILADEDTQKQQQRQQAQEGDSPLRQYALKHVIYHLVDTTKQQESLARILCSLRYIQAKLQVPGVKVEHIYDDYRHEHIQINKAGATKHVSLIEYMKRHPKLLEQIRSYKKFLSDKKQDIQQCPINLLQIAANYSNIERIQQNARVELEGRGWIEDVTAIPETYCIVKKLGGIIRAIDVSADGKSIAAVSKDDDYNVKLHIINPATGDEKVQPIDIKTLNDRVGLLAKFFPDSNNIFVGSLTTLLTSRGKYSPSGFDVQGIDLKDKFSIECADVSAKHFACGLTTFPWGGKSLHLCIFDMRTKKCLKTIEILRYRYGGSAQFGIKACAVAKDKSYVCACVKQSPKPQLRIIVWNISKFQVMNSIDVTNDEITKCLFVGDQTVLLGGGIRSAHTTKASVHHVSVVSDYWNYREVSNKASHRWDETEMSSLFAAHEDAVACCRWYNTTESALIHVWRTGNIERPAADVLRIRGLQETSEMLSGGSSFVFVSSDEIYIYNLDDLENIGKSQDASNLATLPELTVESICFIPRTESVIIVGRSDEQGSEDMYTVYMCDLHQEEMALLPTPFTNVPRTKHRTCDVTGQFKSFRGAGTSSEMCFPSADGNNFIFNADDHLKVWDRINDRVTILPTYDDLHDKHPEFEEFHAIKGFASPKDNNLAVIYGQIPFKIYLYDIRSGSQLRTLDQDANLRPVITDLAFLPSNGLLLAYHRSAEHTLVTWNPKTGDGVAAASVAISYARVSPASDRVVISARKAKREGQIVLRNSDNKVCHKLTVHGTWLPSPEESDLEFSSDGTAVIGVCALGSVCRVWSAANGEILNDLSLTFTGSTDIVGMLTNTHVMFHDDRLTVTDIATGEVTTVCPMDERMERKATPMGMRLSPKGNIAAGARTSSHLKVFHCHNFQTVKRKTTLQRMISFKK